MVVEALRQQGGRRGLGAGFVEEEELVFSDRLVQRGAEFLPVGDQLIERNRVHDGAGQDVGARLGAFFQHADIDLGAFLLGELLQADGGCQAGGAAANDDDVVFHGLAGAVLLQELLLIHCL